MAKQDLTPWLIRAAYASGSYTLKAIGMHFGLHYATVSRIARSGMWQNKT